MASLISLLKDGDVATGKALNVTHEAFVQISSTVYPSLAISIATSAISALRSARSLSSRRVAAMDWLWRYFVGYSMPAIAVTQSPALMSVLHWGIVR